MTGAAARLETEVLGPGVLRDDAERLLRGEGRFLEDLIRGETLHALFLRSPVAHARLLGLSRDAAERLPGVVAILTAEEAARDGLGAIPPLAVAVGRDGDPAYVPPQPVLADEILRYLGEPVALVVAESRAAAQDAIDALDLDYEDLPVAVDPRAALEPGAPRLWEGAPGNLSYHWAAGDLTATEACFTGADRVVELELLNNRVSPLPLEPRGALAVPPESEGTPALLYSGTQMPRALQSALAEAVLCAPAEKLRVVVPDMGGGFGLKGPVFPEQAAVLWAAVRLGRPVAWQAERGEGLLCDSGSRDTLSKIAAALDADHRITALRLSVVANLGAYVIGHGSTVPQGGMGLVTGIYDIGTYHAEVRGAFTNTAPVDAYRGAGRPEVIYALERLMDAAARRVGEDPAAFRARHLIAPEAMPHRLPTGLVFDVGDFGACLETARENLGWERGKERREEAAARGRLYGRGLACFVDRTGGGGEEWARIEALPDGGFLATFGTQSSGQNHARSYARLLAERLGVDAGCVRVVQGDTGRVLGGRGSYGSRSLVLGGGAGLRAVERLIEESLPLAAAQLEAATADVEYRDGGFVVVGTDRRLAFSEIALPEGSGALRAEGRVDPSTFAFPYGCHAVELEVEPETGAVELLRYIAVDDFGVVREPPLLEGQLHGGIAQGLGQALLERLVYDPAGQLLTGSLMDYGLPRADAFPRPELRQRAIPCTTNALGVKGCGEAGAIAAPPAVMNAILDALSVCGVEHLDMPATPERVWAATIAGQGARSNAAREEERT